MVTANIKKHLWTKHVNSYTLYDSVYHVYIQYTYYVYTQTDMYMRRLLWVHTCPDHVYTMYRHGMYNFTFLWTCISRNKNNAKYQDLNPWSCAYQEAALTTTLPAWLFRKNSWIICILFYLEVSDVRQAQDQQRSLPCHDLAGQWINLSTNRSKAPSWGRCLPWQARGTPWPFPGCLKQTLLTERRGLSHGGQSARAGPSWGHNKTICVGLYLN